MGGFLGFREPVVRISSSLPSFSFHLVENLDVNEKEPYSKQFLIEMVMEDQDGSSCIQTAPALCNKHTVITWAAEHGEDTLRKDLSVMTFFFFNFRIVYLIQYGAAYILNFIQMFQSRALEVRKCQDSECSA